MPLHFFQPEWKLADPLCTFVFCTMVVASSSKVIYDALVVMMEGKHYQEAPSPSYILAIKAEYC